MSDDVERRIEEARQKAEREKEAQEFLASLTKDDALVKHIVNPEAYAMRSKAVGQANRGEIKPTDCKHPQVYLRHYTDHDSAADRIGKPLNLYACGVCNNLLWLVDAWGRIAGDG